MKPELRILHLEDDANDYDLTRSLLKREGLSCNLERARNRDEFIRALERGGFDLIFSDFSIPGFNGLKALAMAREKCPQIPFLFVSGTLGEEVAIDTLKAGATDYVLKDRLGRLVPAIRRAVAEANERLGRRRAEDAMVQSEFKYRHLFECLGDAAILCDPATNRVLDANKQAEDLLRRKRSEIIGLKTTEFHSESTLEAYRRWFAETSLPSPRLSFEGEVLAQNGRSIPVGITASQIILHDRRLFLGLYSDLTSRKQLEQQLHQSQKMEAIGQLASGIAHDINNSVSPVLGFTDLLIHGDYGLNAKGKKYVELIATAGQDIAGIVARLSEFYRPASATNFVQELNLNKLVEQAVSLTRPRWRDLPQSHGLTIEVVMNLAPEVPCVSAIESELRGAVTNLLLNAADALPRGGTITCCTRVGPGSGILCSDSPAQVVLEISDTGIGMTEETRKRCLEPFYSTKGNRGTGLGLSMVYGVVQRHQGNIEIQSKLGQGTQIRLSFPIHNPDLHACPVIQNRKAADPRRILYIDDEPVLRELLKELLELDGHQVALGEGGEEGMDLFRSALRMGHPFDAVVTDLGMPRLDGREVARLIKRESPATPVALLTGWAALMKDDQSLAEHVDVILNKPPRLKELRQFLSGLAFPAHSPAVAA